MNGNARETLERRVEPNGILRKDRITTVSEDVEALTAKREPDGRVIVQIGGAEGGVYDWMRRRSFPLLPAEARAYAALLVRLADESDAQAAEPAA